MGSSRSNAIERGTDLNILLLTDLDGYYGQHDRSNTIERGNDLIILLLTDLDGIVLTAQLEQEQEHA